VFKVMLAAAAALTLAACSSSGQPEQTSAQTVPVTVSHYPVQFLVEQVGGDLVEVQSLTSQGTEPHDVELSPQQIGEVQASKAVFYVGGFQPAVDEAVNEAQGDVVDLSEGLALRDQDGVPDPHVWLSPVLMQEMAGLVADTLAQQDPDNADTYQSNAQALQEQLAALNTEWTDATTTCDVRTMVVSHEAFGYLADQYGFDQKGISGLSPETEPSAAAIADLTRFVQDNGVTTVYTEALVDPAVAQTIAAEAGAQTAVLDPLESQPETGDYLSAMSENLDTLANGQSCS